MTTESDARLAERIADYRQELKDIGSDVDRRLRSERLRLEIAEIEAELERRALRRMNSA